MRAARRKGVSDEASDSGACRNGGGRSVCWCDRCPESRSRSVTGPIETGRLDVRAAAGRPDAGNLRAARSRIAAASRNSRFCGPRTVVRASGLPVRDRRLHRSTTPPAAGHLSPWNATVPAAAERGVRLHPAKRHLELPPHDVDIRAWQVGDKTGTATLEWASSPQGGEALDEAPRRPLDAREQVVMWDGQPEPSSRAPCRRLRAARVSSGSGSRSSVPSGARHGVVAAGSLQ